MLKVSVQLESVELGLVPLLDFPPAEFHRRCQAVVLDRERFGREEHLSTNSYL